MPEANFGYIMKYMIIGKNKIAHTDNVDSKGKDIHLGL